MPLPAPEESTHPNLQVLPAPAAKRSRSDLNQAQQTALTKAAEICTVALKPEYLAALESRGISKEFVLTLVKDIMEAGSKARAAVESMHARKAATRIQAEAEQRLVDSLRALQAAARQKHLPDNPHLLGNYYVGQNLAENRSLLEAISQNVIDRADEERPPGVNTEVITRVSDERAAYLQALAAQAAEVGKGKLGRAERDALVKSIMGRRKTIQYAADALWPIKKADSARARSEFQLPSNRPYSY